MSSVNDNSMGLGSAIPVSGPGPQGGQGVQVPKGVAFFDELSPSEKKDLLEMIYASQNPSLIPPLQYIIDTSNQTNANSITAANQATASSITAAAMAADFQDTKNQIIISMLDKWLQSEHEIAEESRKAELKRLIDGISIAFHTYQHQIDPTYDPHFPTFSVGVVLGAIGVHEALLITPHTEVALNPIAQMAQAAIPPVMGDMRAELGLIGTLMIYGYGLQYATAAEFAKKGNIKGGEELDEKAFAQNYADNVLAVIGNPGFNNFLTAIVTQKYAESNSLDDEQKSQSEEQKSQAMATVKLVLLASALQALYYAETGGMSGKEFQAMLREKQNEGDDVLKFADGDQKNNFIYLIKGYLTFLEPVQQTNLITALTNYFENNRSVNTLADPAKVLAGVYASLPRGEIPA